MIRDPLYQIECLTAPSYTKYLTPSADKPVAPLGAPTQPGHRGGGAGFIDKH